MMEKQTVKLRLFLLVLVIFVSAAIPKGVSHAQDRAITLKLAISEFRKDMFTDQLIKDFETTYSNIKIQLVSTTEPEFFRTRLSIENYLDTYQHYASSADVLSLDTIWMPWTAIQAGYFLD